MIASMPKVIIYNSVYSFTQNIPEWVPSEQPPYVDIW
jgi:hypothetical protein